MADDSPHAPNTPRCSVLAGRRAAAKSTPLEIPPFGFPFLPSLSFVSHVVRELMDVLVFCEKLIRRRAAKLDEREFNIWKVCFDRSPQLLLQSLMLILSLFLYIFKEIKCKKLQQMC